MRRLLPMLILPAAVLRGQAQMIAAASREAPRIIIPGTPVGRSGGSTIILPGSNAPIGAPTPPLIVPDAPKIVAPGRSIVVAERPLTEAEAAPSKVPSQDDLKTLAKSLAPSAGPGGAGAADAERAGALGASFDGKLAPEASDWNGVSAEFARGPLAPGLPAVETAARSLIARLLPSFYRRVPVTAAYDRGANPSTGHTWTPEKGHVIELLPVRADSRGEVPSAFGAPNETRVQQKIEFLMGFAHEYFHVLFDSAVRRAENHPPHSAYSALTEGFAVSGEQLLVNRILDNVPSLGFGPRDALDLSAITRARSRWLDVQDTHYAEGVLSWRKAYERGGTAGLLEFLSSLSASRMIAVPRSDPAYQLALGEPELLSAYLGRDESSPARRGLEAFAKAARGETLTEAEAREASAAVEQAGADGWRRLFERALFADKRLKDAKPGVAPAFASARLSPAAGAALAKFLAESISSPGGGARLFEHPGPNEKLTAIVAGAETLPWDESGRRAWNDGLARWLTGAR